MGCSWWTGSPESARGDAVIEASEEALIALFPRQLQGAPAGFGIH
jgi:hypothetical protein